MAAVEKFAGSSSISTILRHNSREIAEPSNRDIMPDLSDENYSLTPDHGGMSDFAYYKARLSELYVYGQGSSREINTMAGWIVSCPKELTTREEQDAFFRTTEDFLEQRYGRENVVQAIVHYDEGKREPVLDPQTGEPQRDDQGKMITRLVCGSPHLHFEFIPVRKIDHGREHAKQKYDHRTDEYDEKVCADDVLTRKELRRFHPDLQAYLDKHLPFEAKVLTGITKAQGRNYTVGELKMQYETTKMEQELSRLREIEKKYNKNRTHDRTRRW